MENLNEDKLYSLLCNTKRRCELLTGVKSLTALENYINGYIDACLSFDSDSATLRWYNAFMRYVAAACGIKQDHFSLTATIKSCGYDDVNGVDFFMELLDQFVQENCQAEPGQMRTGELRVFCIDQHKATELIGKYLQEHCEEYFGLPDIQKETGYVLKWLENGCLLCALCDNADAAAILSTENGWLCEKMGELSAFSTGDRVSYSKLWPQDT